MPCESALRSLPFPLRGTITRDVRQVQGRRVIRRRRWRTHERFVKTVLKYVQGAFYVVAGMNHFINPAFYMKIMPPYLPWQAMLVFVSGLAEVFWACCWLFRARRSWRPGD